MRIHFSSSTERSIQYPSNHSGNGHTKPLEAHPRLPRRALEYTTSFGTRSSKRNLAMQLLPHLLVWECSFPVQIQQTLHGLAREELARPCPKVGRLLQS